METSGCAVLVSPTRGQQREPAVAEDTAHRQAEDSLYQVIEKLSEIVDRQRSGRCSLSGTKRPRLPCGLVGSPKKPKNAEGSEARMSGGQATKDPAQEPPGGVGMDLERSGKAMEGGVVTPGEAWFSRELCGGYRCLICSYVCGQQRALKTHAWKHAGLLRCSYPVFPDTPNPSPPPGPGATPLPPPALTAEAMPELELQVTVETDVGGARDRPLSSVQVIFDGDAEISVGAERLPQGEPILMHHEAGLDSRALEQEEEEEEEEDENLPPSRSRTPSESLRLHSLAAEALVAMPMTAPAPPNPNNADTRIPEESASPPSLTEGVARAPAQTGISLSLLSVIEKLRTNEDASDEDILRELRDDGQAPPGEGAAVREGDLAEAWPSSERVRPFPLPPCGGAGEVRPGQLPLTGRHAQPCPRPARDSAGPEDRVMRRCKTRVHCCTARRERQLQNDENNQHGFGETLATMAPVIETMMTTEDSLEQEAVKEASLSVYRCDACDYTSSTSVGVRNHQRMHGSEKPYRCCSCDFATTNMNSLRSHMKSHPQDHQSVQLLEQYRCALCGYVCSHPPSLKSHMWKHAHDQNYDYEQVNRAIDDAILQSGRALAAPRSAGPGSHPRQQACVAEDGAEKATPCSGPRSGAPADRAVDEPSPAVSRPGGTAATPSLPGAEYCLLLFCCCICGFESPSKERLVAHMKRHEGEIVSIIMSRDQQPAAPPTSY